MKSFFYIILILAYNAKLIRSIDPLVVTTQGLVLGQKADDGDYSQFLGIPYAKVNPDNPFGVSFF